MFSRKRIVLLSFMLLGPLILVCAGCGKWSNENRRFERLSKEFLEEYFKANPVAATWVGDHRYDRELPDVSPEAVRAEVAYLRNVRIRLESIDSDKLSRDNKIDAGILKDHVDLIILFDEEIRSFEKDPMAYTDVLGNSIYCFISRDFAPLDKRLDAAADRLAKFPTLIEQAMQNLTNPPKVRTETAISQNRGLISLIENDLMKEAEKAPRQKKKIEEVSGPALEALRAFQNFLEMDLLNRSLGDARLGDRVFRRLLAGILESDMTSEEIVAAAYAEIDRVHDEMFELAAPLYAEMTSRAPSANATAGERRDVIKRVMQEIALDHPKPTELLDACRAAYAEATAFVRDQNILAVPDDPLEIIWAPEYSRGISTMGLETHGPLDKGVRFRFVVSPIPDYYDEQQVESFLREYNYEMIRTVTIHEAMPGHFVQFTYANRNPSLIRAVFGNSSFIEGWAVYAVDLLLERGFRSDDPKLKLQWKKFYLRTLINAILDSGMHRENMSEYEALKLMTEDGFQEESEAAVKWRRAALTPGYLSTYYVGYRELRDLRRDAEARWGTGFKLNEFHEKLLSEGAVAPKFARRLLLEE
jgi:uncharacterized protein (DUF885 family)